MICFVTSRFLEDKIHGALDLILDDPEMATDLEALLVQDFKKIGKAEKSEKIHNISDNEVIELYNLFKIISPTTSLEMFTSWISGETVKTMGSPEGPPIDSMENYSGNVKVPLNFIDRAYGESSAKSMMLRTFNSNIIRSVIVDLKNNAEILDDEVSLNTKIGEFKEELYKDIKTYIEEETGKKLPLNLFSTKDVSEVRTNVGLAEVNKLIENSTNEELKNLYLLRQKPRVLSTWKSKSIGADDSYAKKLKAYNAYFILNHFDSLLADLFGSFILSLTDEFDLVSLSPKRYRFEKRDESNMTKNWQQEDIFTKSAYDLIPKHLLRFLESLEIINEAGKGTGQYLTKNHLTYIIKLIKKNLRKDKRIILSVSNIDTLSWDQLLNIVKEDIPGVSDTVATDLAFRLLDRPKDSDGNTVLTLKNLVNGLRDYPELGLKTIFEVRKYLYDAGKKLFANKMDKRLFDNLYNYLFADKNSLYSSSRYMYGELASLFDSMSVLDHTQYRVNEKGYITIEELSPENQEMLKFKRKRMINAAFIPGEMARYKKKYGGTLTNKNTVIKGSTTTRERKVEFFVRGSNGQPYWKFTFRPLEDAWTLERRSSKDPEKFEVYDPNATENGRPAERAKLTFDDLKGLNEFIIDTLGFDFYNSPEQWDALIDITNSNNDIITDARRENLTRIAINNLLDICVRIYSNALMFRQDVLRLTNVDPKDSLLVDKEYVVFYEGRDPVRYYTTLNDEGYFKTIKVEGEDVQVNDTIQLTRKFGRGKGNLNFKTKEELKRIIKENLGNVFYGGNNLYTYAIEDWYGSEKKDQVRPSSVYLSVDIISSKVDTEYFKPIVELEALITGATYKNLVDTAERTKITVGSGSMLFYEKESRLEAQGKDPSNPMSILNDYLQEGYDGNSFSRELNNRPEVKQNKDFNFKENFYSCFVADFLLPLYMHGDIYKNARVSFTEAVNSDKPNVPKLNILKGQIMTPEDAKTMIKYALGDAYRACFYNIELDYKKLTKEYIRLIKKDAKKLYKTEQEWKLAEAQIDKHFENLDIKLSDNFLKFNQWCKDNNTTPIELLGKMTMLYNKWHKKNPLAFYQGIHYCIDSERGNENNFYINQSFIESVLRFTRVSQNDLEARKAKIQATIKDLTGRSDSYETRTRLEHLLSNLNKHLPNVILWNKTLDTLKEFYKARNAGDAEKEGFEIDSNINYDNFITYSNLHFLHNMLKNDVTLDFNNLEGEMLLHDCLNNILKDLDDEGKKNWKSKWMSYYGDRMAFGYLKVWNGRSKKYEDSVDKEQSSLDKQRPIQLTSRVDMYGLYNKKGKEKIYSTNNKFSLTKQLYKVIDGKEKKVSIEVNPLLQQYNLNHYYWTSLENLSVTGSHVWSDAKKFTRTLDEESAKWFDSVKRNVINSATSTQFRLGSMWGVPIYANIAVVDDIRAVCSDIFGGRPSVKPYDGATFVNPFMYYWENYSLNNQVTGITKKPIYEFYDERVMAGGLIKTASFALTNDEIRNSPWNARAMWKMTQAVWEDRGGNLMKNLDLTLGLTDLTLKRTDTDIPPEDRLVEVNGITRSLNGEGICYFEQYNDDFDTELKRYTNHKVVKEIVSFKRLPDTKDKSNQYEIITYSRDARTGEYLLDENNQIKTTKEVKVINSNYTFWKALGGSENVVWNKDLKEFLYSEKSMYTVAKWASKIRFDRSGKQDVYTDLNSQYYSDKFTENEKNILNHDVRYWYNPMKESDIHYIVTAGAIKKGAANINSAKYYKNDQLLNYYKIKLSLAGILLDPEHTADLSEVSLMTLVISGLADRGYTSGMANEVYEALSSLSELAINKYYIAFKKAFDEGDRQQIQKLVTGLLLDELLQTKSDNRVTNIARALAESLIERGKRGETLEFEDIRNAIPFSDGSIFELLLSTVTSTINKKAIREKMFGSLSTLRPSHDIHRICGTKRLGELTNFDEVRKMQDNLNKKELDSISLTEIGRCYTIKGNNPYAGQVIDLYDSDYYYLWKTRLANKDYKLVETLYSFGDEVDCTNLHDARIHIRQNDGQFKFYKLTYKKGKLVFSRIQKIGTVDELTNLSLDTKLIKAQAINLYGRNLGSYNVHMNLRSRTPISINRYDLSSVQGVHFAKIKNKVISYLLDAHLTNKDLTNEVWKDILLSNRESTDKVDLWKVAYASNLDIYNNLNQEKTLLEELNAITSGRNLKYYDKHNRLQTGKVANHSVTHFEAILPMIYASQFGIRAGDSLALIVQDPNFFFKRNLENYISGALPLDKLYDICIKRADGKHVYIKYAGEQELKNLGFTELKISIYTDSDGRIFRLDPYSKNRKMYALSDPLDKVFNDSSSDNEIIVTKNINFYLKNLDYVGLHFSENIKNKEVAETIKLSLKSSKGKIAKYISDILEEKNGVETYLEAQRTLVQKINEYMNSNDKKAKGEELSNLNHKIISIMSKLSKKQHASFRESLKFTVARIPALGMQSFMAMDIVGFNNTGVNDCYVSAELIRLQGSDYDVDKATFLGHAFNKAGLFIKWSKYFKLDTFEDIEASKVLPFPTSMSGELLKGDTNSIDFTKYRLLFYDSSSKKEKANEEKEGESNIDKADREEESSTTSKFKLKQYRDLKLLAQLLNEVNALAKQQKKNNEDLENFVLTYKDNEQLAIAIMDVVNNHNLYLNDIPIESRGDVLKNFIASRVFSISEHPANALVGGVSVDEVVKPLKNLSDTSNTGHKPTESRPGDSSINWLALNLNLGGKDVIGITASNGQKCYFGMSHVTNRAIAENKELKPYMFEVKFYDKENKKENEYHFISDPFLDLNTDLSEEEQLAELNTRLSNSNISRKDIKWLFDRFKEKNQWADSYLSGILSLATDNAKELRLDLLNAGKDLAGLYLYGIQIGIPIKLIFNTMTSTTAQVLSRLMKTNGFTYDDLSGNLKSAIKILEEDHSGKLNSLRRSGSVEIMQKKLKDAGLEIKGLDTQLTMTSLITISDADGSNKLGTKDSIIKIIELGDFEKYLKRLKVLRNDLINYAGSKERTFREEVGEKEYIDGYTWEQIRVKRTINEYIHYAYDIYEMYTLSKKEGIDIFTDLKNIKTLNEGFAELGNLRQLLGLNQGVKTKSADKLKFYEDFATLISKRISDADLGSNRSNVVNRAKSILGDSMRINFREFFTNKLYRLNVIELYDDIKHTVNPLRIVTELPHFNSYLFIAFIDYSNCSISSKFRVMVDHIMPFINLTFGPRNKVMSANYIRKALDYIDGIITNRWLVELVPMLIPKGNMAIDKSGNMVESKTDFYILLGTTEGNATFLRWMNQEVIPRLKEGILKNKNVSKYSEVLSTKGTDDSRVNTFLRDLIPNMTNKTSDRNNTQVFALPIDMIPKSDIDADKLSKYKSDFSELNYYQYLATDSESYNIADLLFKYNLINFRNKGGEQSFTPLFEGLIQTKSNDTINSYFEFVAELDREYDLTPNVDFTMDDLAKMIAPSTSEIKVSKASSDKIPYLWSQDKETLKNSLYVFTNPDKETKGMGSTLLEREGYKPETTPVLHVYPLNFANIKQLEKGKPVEINMNTMKADVTLSVKNKVPKITVDNMKVFLPNGKTEDISKGYEISGEELVKLLKVESGDKGYKYTVNPISLLIHLSSKRRANCKK